MANFFDDNDDLRFYVDRAIDWAPIIEAASFGGALDESPQEVQQTYRDFLELIGQFAADEIAPYSGEMDADGTTLSADGEASVGPRMAEIFEKMAQLDLHRLCIPTQLGGMNAPFLVYLCAVEMLARADVSATTHFGFHGGMALAALFYSVREGTTEFDVEARDVKSTRFQAMIDEIADGREWGSMDITEPDAGSDMAALRAHAEQDEQGNWQLTGQKIFITSGHGKYHFVIARTEQAGDAQDPFAGLGGLSLFLVEAWQEVDGERRRHVTIDRLEEKLGHHGSVTATLSFDKAPAQLIGKRGEGFKYMLVLMNNARLAVGFESLGLMESALRKATAYAAERGSMGKTIDRHEMIADMLDRMDCETKAIRALAFEGAAAEELSHRYKLILDHLPPGDSAQRQKMERTMKTKRDRARALTPLLKYVASERSVEFARMAIQIHGGNGYIKEYGVEQLLRDAMVFPIYEGTSQIQALMVVKDSLSAVLKAPQAFVKQVARARVRAMASRDPLERRLAKLQVLAGDAQQYLIRKTAADKVRGAMEKPMLEWAQLLKGDWDPKRDFAWAMLHAERYTQLLADVATAEILWDQAQQHGERRNLLERFLDRAEPRCRHMSDLIHNTGAPLLAALARRNEADTGPRGAEAAQ